MILTYRRGNFVYHHWSCTSIQRQLSYPFRSTGSFREYLVVLKEYKKIVSSCSSHSPKSFYRVQFIAHTMVQKQTKLYWFPKFFSFVGLATLRTYFKSCLIGSNQHCTPTILIYRRSQFIIIICCVYQFIAHCIIPKDNN